MISIQKIELPIAGIDVLRAEAHNEDHNYIDTLLNEWATEKNRFEAPGEILCGHLDQGLLVAVAGLNIDPFAARPDTCRIRRVYVRPAWRNKGIGQALVSTLVEHARQNFQFVRLRAISNDAARLYERMGFSVINRENATHILSLQ
jgi:N-acetylglutamate synthase-like GNAT family acetyltransferase